MIALLQPLARLTLPLLLAVGVVTSRGFDQQPIDSEPIVQLEPAIVIDGDDTAVVPADLDVVANDSEIPELPVEDDDTLYRICRVTAYCDRGTTAAGVPSGVGQCAAPGYIPFGSKIYIPKLDKTFVVTDRTNVRFRNSTVDLFMPSKRDCRQFGRSYLECEIIIESPEIRAANVRQFARG